MVAQGEGRMGRRAAGEGGESWPLPVPGAYSLFSGLPCLSNPAGSSLTCPLCPITGPVTNAFIVLAPANMFNPDGKPSVPLPKFSRHLHGTESSDEPGTDGVTLRLGLHQEVPGATGPWGGGTDIQEGLCQGKALL